MSAFISVKVTQIDSNNFNISINSEKNETATDSENRIANAIKAAITSITSVSNEILDSTRGAKYGTKH